MRRETILGLIGIALLILVLALSVRYCTPPGREHPHPHPGVTHSSPGWDVTTFAPDETEPEHTEPARPAEPPGGGDKPKPPEDNLPDTGGQKR